VRVRWRRCGCNPATGRSTSAAAQAARVAFFGAKTSRAPFGWVLNGVLRHGMARLTFASTPLPTDAPWTIVGPELQELVVHEYFMGWMFLATGTWVPREESQA